ncbi:MAG: hypothetical protein ACC682_00220 [Gemmatimonadota bacterium]
MNDQEAFVGWTETHDVEEIRKLVDAGAKVDDDALNAVLLDDGDAVGAALAGDRGAIDRRHTDAGADLEARAAVDEHGLGGKTTPDD